MIKSLILAATLLACFSRFVLNGAVIPVTDTNFRNALTLDDWVMQPDSVNSTVCGASFTLGFKGTQNVTLQVDNAHLSGLTASRYPIIAWTVNGGSFQSHQLVAGETSVALASSVTNPIIDFYIEGMSPFDDRYNGDVPTNSVKITGFMVNDGGATFSVVLPKKIWLNIGDSIMSGDEALYSAGEGRPADDVWAASDNGRASYGYLLARHYGYRETRLAYGGYDWAGGLANVPSLATLIDQKTSTISRLVGSKLDPIPDVVLINLGENGAPALSDVTNGLFKIRSRVNPGTKIIVMIPISGKAQAQVIQGFNSYTNSSQDTNIFLVNLGAISYATGDGQHPTAQGHQTVYNYALPYFDSIIAPAPLRICPMGDSITAGYTDNPYWMVPFEFGYRRGLYASLTNGDMLFQYVGSSPEPWNGVSGTVTNTPIPDLRLVGQDHHEGYSGKGTAFVLSNIGNWLTNDQPDVVLLQVGINDIAEGSTDEPVAAETNLSNIVAAAVNINPDIRMIVAQITPYNSYTAAIIAYNNYIANVLVPYFAGQGYLVSTVNQYANLCVPGTTNIDASLFANGISHPKTIAYDRMAQTWLAGLQQYYYFTTTSQATVAVDTQPATASAFVGEPITFSASFAGGQPLTYQWQFISGGVTNVLVGETNMTLTITDLQLTNSGGYFLQASNILGIANSATGALTVSILPTAVNSIITAIATETGRGIGTFEPGWVVVTNNSLIASQAPSSAVGNFSEEIGGRSVNSLTAGGDAGLTKISNGSSATSSTNYVTCGNGSGAGSSIIYTLGGSANGYNLTNITVYGGWADYGRDQQAYTIYYSTVLAPTNFLLLAPVSYNPAIGAGIQSATRVAFLSATGSLAANVAAVKFDFTTPGSENGYCGYQQIALFGTPATSISSNPPPTIIQTSQFGLSLSALDTAIVTNLVRAKQSSLESVVVSHGPSISSKFTTAGLNDGSAAANANYAYYAINDSSGGNLPVTITFNLNTNSATGGFPAGYAINSLQVLSGWSDSNLANQNFQLLLSLNGGPFNSYGVFSSITNTTALNNGNNSILQTLTGNSNPIATGVTAVQFIFLNPGGSQGGSGGSLIREIQVFGVPVVNLKMQPTTGNQFQLTWPTGLLLEATNIYGAWTTNTAASPYTITPTNPQMFYRVQIQ